MQYLGRSDNKVFSVKSGDIHIYSKHIEIGIPHIWVLDLRLLSKRSTEYECFLTTKELLRAKKFRFEKDKKTFVVVRGILRELSGQYLRIAPKDIRLRYTKYGKPELDYPKNNLHFNVSHASEIAIIGFSLGVPIGVDVEFVKYANDLEKVAKRFFSKNEYDKYMSLSGDEKLKGFYNCWTRKEAFIKAIGHGLSFPLDQFEVSFLPRSKVELVSTNFDAIEKNFWRLFSISVPENYVAACALRQNINRIMISNIE